MWRGLCCLCCLGLGLSLSWRETETDSILNNKSGLLRLSNPVFVPTVTVAGLLLIFVDVSVVSVTLGCLSVVFVISFNLSFKTV